MRILNFRRAVAAALAAGGLFVGGSSAAAQTVHDVPDASFEEIGLGELDYYYFQGPPNSPFWTKGANSAGNNAVYNTLYATDSEPSVPDPRTGDQAVDGEGAYNFQILEDTFVAGRTYTYSMYTQGHDVEDTNQVNFRLWLYFFVGIGAEGDQPVSSFDNDSLVRVTFHQDGTLLANDPNGVGSGAKGVLPFTGFNKSSGSDWTQVGLTYTATAEDEGKRIGLAFWANEFGAVDDVALTSVGGGVPGDYNGNNVVDAADYTVWRDHMGEAFQLDHEGDGISPGEVQEDDYTFWVSQFGMAAGASNGSLAAGAVPEPSTVFLGTLAIGGFGVVTSRRRRA